MRGEATVVAILIAAFMSLLAPLMLLNPAGMLTGSAHPEILDARVAPEKIPPGDPLYITAWVKDPSGTESVYVYIENEAGVDKVRMTLSSGSLYDGMFEAKWVSHDTLDKKWYNATIIATNTGGLSSYVILPWQDPTQGHAASQVRAGTFSAGNYAFPNNLTAGGILFVDNSTGRVGIGNNTPDSKLTVNGTIESTYDGFKFPDGTNQSTAGSTFRFLATPATKVDWSAATAWTDVDISSDTGSDTATAVLLSVELDFMSSSNDALHTMTGLARKNGDTETTKLPLIKATAWSDRSPGEYNRLGRGIAGGMWIVECDADEIFEVQLSTVEGSPASISFQVHLIGYII